MLHSAAASSVIMYVNSLVWKMLCKYLSHATQIELLKHGLLHCISPSSLVVKDRNSTQTAS